MAHVAAFAQLAGPGGDGEVFGLDARDDGVEGAHRLLDGARVFVPVEVGQAGGLAGVVEARLGHWNAEALFDQVRVDVELAAVAVEARAVVGVGVVGLGAVGFEVHQADCAVFVHDEVYFAGEDVVVFDEGNVHFGVADVVPIVLVTLVVAQDVGQRGLALRRRKVGVFALGERGVIGVEPTLHPVGGERRALAAQDGAVDVFDGLVDEDAEEDGLGADGGEFEFAEEAVLFGAVLEEGDVRGEGVFALEVDVLEACQRQGGGIEGAPIRQGIDVGLEVFRRDRRDAARARPRHVGEHEEVLGAREGGVVEAAEVVLLDARERLERRAREVAGLEHLVQISVRLARAGVQRSDQDDGEFETLRLVDGEE